MALTPTILKAHISMACSTFTGRVILLSKTFRGITLDKVNWKGQELAVCSIEKLCSFREVWIQ